jgi:5'-nucleotidase
MKRIAVDMDGVLADVYAQYFRMHYEESGELLTPGQASGKTETEAFPQVRKYLLSKGFFIDAPVIADSQRVLKRLNAIHEIFIVSSATEFPGSLAEKQAWLHTHFPFIGWQQMVFCGSKRIIQADIMIDDHFKNLDFFKGETILFTQPHNIFSDAGRHRRVNHWKEIERLFPEVVVQPGERQ